MGGAKQSVKSSKDRTKKAVKSTERRVKRSEDRTKKAVKQTDRRVKSSKDRTKKAVKQTDRRVKSSKDRTKKAVKNPTDSAAKREKSKASARRRYLERQEQLYRLKRGGRKISNPYFTKRGVKS
jgi:hypothetical protein